MIVLIIVAAVVGIALVVAVVNWLTEASVNVAGTAIRGVMPAARQSGPGFRTTLSPAAAAEAAREAAARIGATDIGPRSGGNGLTIELPSGARSDVIISAQSAGGSRLKIIRGPGCDEDTIGRFRGSLLAALRERDPATRQSS